MSDAVVLDKAGATPRQRRRRKDGRPQPEPIIDAEPIAELASTPAEREPSAAEEPATNGERIEDAVLTETTGETPASLSVVPEGTPPLPRRRRPRKDGGDKIELP